MCEAPTTTTRTTLVTARWDRHDEDDDGRDQADDDHDAGDKEDEDKDTGEKL